MAAATTCAILDGANHLNVSFVCLIQPMPTVSRLECKTALSLLWCDHSLHRYFKTSCGKVRKAPSQCPSPIGHNSPARRREWQLYSHAYAVWSIFRPWYFALTCYSAQNWWHYLLSSSFTPRLLFHWNCTQRSYLWKRKKNLFKLCEVSGMSNLQIWTSTSAKWTDFFHWWI